jgi:hypothetical protein
MHGTDRVLQDLPVTGWKLDGDFGADIKSTGNCTIVYQSEAGESLVPEGTKGVLSPFRASLAFSMEITAGGFTERINLGTFKVSRVVSGRNFYAAVNGREYVSGSEVEVEFASLDLNISRSGFHYPEQPPQRLSVYEELRRITGLPVEEILPDTTIPKGLTYEAEQGGRLKGVQQLARLLGGVAVVNSAGAYTVIPEGVGDPVGSLGLGEEGTVVDVGYEVDTDNVYNVVVGVFERDDDQAPLYAVARAPEGDLDPAGLYGEYTRYYSSDMVKTQAQANAAVQSVLDLSLGSQQYDVPIKCHVNPLVELGDVLELKGWDRPIVGQLVNVSMSDNAMMDVTLRVQRRLL